METLIAAVHVLTALFLIALVLLQDSKGGGMGGAFGGGTSQSVFGATGAATLAQKVTRYAAMIFAVTSIALSSMSTRKSTSVVDGMPSEPAAATAPATTETVPAEPTTTTVP